MKILTNYAYDNIYNKPLPFKNRTRVGQHNCTTPSVQSNNPNIRVYLYEDSSCGLDIDERTYDSFTGLRDKNYLLAVLNKKIEQSQMNGKPLSFAMFDMDNFKSVNELLGYEIGDDFIKFIANSVYGVAKENTLNAYRFGGEEFVVLFENQDEDTQKDVVNKIISSVNSNKYIKVQEEAYLQNAEDRVTSYSMQIAKIKKLYELKAKKAIYDDLEENFETKEAKNDPYLLKSIGEVSEGIKNEYINLLYSSLPSEADRGLRNYMLAMLKKLQNNEKISPSEYEAVDEYLKFKFDKSAELFQVKKWLKDFKNNKGFSITGSVVSFNPQFMRNKTPMQLIGIAGEALKRGKDRGKGRGYFD